jgi:drug/metabolite transporter (DMT)-like permease
MALVGSSVVVGKLVVARIPVFLVGGLRFALAAVILVPLLVLLERPRAVRARDAGVLAIQALTGIFAFNTLLLYGLSYTSAAASGIVASTTPAVAAALAVILLGEKGSWRRGAAIALAVLGVGSLTATAPSPAATGDRPLLGTALVFGAVVGEGLFIVCSRVVSRRLSPLTAATGLSVLGFLMFLPFAAAEARTFEFSRLAARDWLAIAYYAVAVTVIAFLCWTRGVAQVPASTAAVFTGVLPVSAILLSYVLLGEPFSWGHIAGAAAVVAGIGLLAGEPAPAPIDS